MEWWHQLIEYQCPTWASGKSQDWPWRSSPSSQDLLRWCPKRPPESIHEDNIRLFQCLPAKERVGSWVLRPVRRWPPACPCRPHTSGSGRRPCISTPPTSWTRSKENIIWIYKTCPVFKPEQKDAQNIQILHLYPWLVLQSVIWKYVLWSWVPWKWADFSKFSYGDILSNDLHFKCTQT